MNTKTKTIFQCRYRIQFYFSVQCSFTKLFIVSLTIVADIKKLLFQIAPI